MNAEDSPCCRRRLTHRLLIDKVIYSSGGELFDAVVEARWVHGVHFHRGRNAQHTRWGKSSDFGYRMLFKPAIPRIYTGRFRADVMWSSVDLHACTLFFDSMLCARMRCFMEVKCHHIFDWMFLSRTQPVTQAAPHRAATEQNSPGNASTTQGQKD